MHTSIFKYILILTLLFFQNSVSQQYEEEDEQDGEDESEADVNVPSTTKKIDPILNMNFTEQFQMLTSQVDAAQKTNRTNTTVTFTTRKPQARPRPTNRVEQIGSSVNGILGSVGALNIPGIVDNALSIRNNEPVREFVVGIMEAIFCSPILNNFSTCGQRLGTKTRSKPKPTNVTTASPAS